MPIIRPASIIAIFLVAAAIFSCGDDDDGGASPTSAPPSSSQSSRGPSASPGELLTPPLEGPRREGTVTERTDFREEPGWLLPMPDEVPEPDDAGNPIFNPPPEGTCPDGWTLLPRPTEGFQICYPPDWVTDGQGYVSSANEERWYSVGIFDFEDQARQRQLAHVSVYVIPQFTRPLRYTLDCEQPFSVTFAGLPAVVCADFPGSGAEENIVSYHVFRENLDYFIQIVDYGEDDDAVEVARDIAFTLQFTDVIDISSQ